MAEQCRSGQSETQNIRSVQYRPWLHTRLWFLSFGVMNQADVCDCVTDRKENERSSNKREKERTCGQEWKQLVFFRMTRKNYSRGGGVICKQSNQGATESDQKKIIKVLRESIGSNLLSRLFPFCCQ